MKVTTKITSGTLTSGERVEGVSTGYTQTGRVAFTSTWSGVFDREALDTHDGREMYLYFTDGHINGIPQAHHGFPTAQMDACGMFTLTETTASKVR